jgi:hypothetical protein
MLRDSEFCCTLHRKKYGERLGKALHEIAAPAPAPAGVAGFLIRMPLQPGKHASTLTLQTASSRSRFRACGWPLTADLSDVLSDTLSDAPGEPAPVADSAPVGCPPRSERCMSAPPPEPVAAWLHASAALAPAGTPRAPRFAAAINFTPLLDRAPGAPPLCQQWLPAPAVEPVAAWLHFSAALAPAGTPRAPRFAAAINFTPLPDRAPGAPPLCQRWLPAPAVEPVAAWLHASAALAPADTPRAPRFAAAINFTPLPDRVPGAPPLCQRWLPAPPPEPVAAWLHASAALAPADTPRAPRFAAAINFTSLPDRAPGAPPLCQRWLPAPPPEPVAAWLHASAALAPTDTPRAPRFAAAIKFAPVLDGVLDTPPVCQRWMPAPAAEPAAEPQHTVLQFTAEPEPLAAPDRPFATPPMCRQWMPTPPPDAVFSYLRTSTAPAVAVPVALKLPAVALPAAARRVAGIAQPLSMAYAEPVTAAVRPATANAPAIPFHQETEMALPALPPAAGRQFQPAEPASPPAPQAMESLPVAARAARPVWIEHAPVARGEFATPPAIFQPVPAVGEPLAGPAPAALESPLVASLAAPFSLAVALRMPPFALAANQKRATAPLDARRLAPRARKPVAAAPGRVAPRPLATLAIAAPAHAWPMLESGLPHPGPLPIEFHTHRPTGVPAARPKRLSPRLALQPPKFALRPILEKLEEPAPQPKNARHEPDCIEILKRPTVRRPATVLMVAGRAAAGFLLAASLGVGVANFSGNRHLATREGIFSSDAAVSTADNASSVNVSNGGAPAQPARPGPVAWVRQAIANRAALRIAENFHGMENWDRGPQGDAAGWSRHPDGYMSTGALALFRPTLKFTNYRLEFFGQIESKSIGWTVRATDARNYHAMKLTVAEAGIRPFVALVHYDVVDGKSGRPTRTPLNVMVHNNQPMQLAVDVRGNRLVTSIDGEEVDSFLDDTLLAGGVGFFSEAGERARLYWMRVSRNDDFLGHVCTLLADVAGVEISAGMRRPEFPGGAPAPGLPADGDGRTLAAVWLGLPYLGGARKARFLGTWRSQSWNT